MKNVGKLMMIAAAMLLIATTGFDAASQNCQNKGKQCQAGMCAGMDDFSYVPDLTADQKKQIQDLKLILIRETTQIKNQINEKKAHLITVSTGDKVDMNAVNQTIDELFALKASLAKRHVQYMQDVRKLLTDNQKIIFDAHRGKCMSGGEGAGCGSGGGQKCGKGGGQCQNSGNGCGQGQGQGCGNKAGCGHQGGGQQCCKTGEGSKCNHQGQGCGKGDGSGPNPDCPKKDKK